MADPEIQRWQQKHPIYLWYYTEGARHYPGWHLTTNVAGSRDLVELLGLMRNAKWPAKKTLKATPPTPEILCVPNNRRGNARWKSIPHLVIKFSEKEYSGDHWSMDLSDQALTLELGKTYLAELATALQRIPDGEGDYSVGSGSNDHREPLACLWFWSFPIPAA